MKMYNYKELSNISGEKPNSLSTRASRLKILGILGGDKQVYFTRSQAFRILNEHKVTPVKNHPRKIEVVEMYIARMGIRNIANALRITENAVEMYVREYRKDGFLVIDSSINLNLIKL